MKRTGCVQPADHDAVGSMLKFRPPRTPSRGVESLARQYGAATATSLCARNRVYRRTVSAAPRRRRGSLGALVLAPGRAPSSETVDKRRGALLSKETSHDAAIRRRSRLRRRWDASLRNTETSARRAGSSASSSDRSASSMATSARARCTRCASRSPIRWSMTR